MNSSKPYFSVVMPTYNRAKLLPLAIKSVLGQSFEDFELVISNGGSTDETREVVASFDDPRIRYIEAKERLSIGDNYQSAFDHARGEFITFLGDDDAFVPTMFEQVKQIIEQENAEIVSYKIAHYYHEDYVETDHSLRAANSLFVPEHTDVVEKFSGRRALELLYNIHGLNRADWNRKFTFPALANAVYHHEVFARVSQKNKQLFALTPADMYLAAAVFFVVENYYCLDKPLLVWSRWSGNSTASPQKKGEGLRRHYENLLNGEVLENTPLKFPLPLNCTINAILQADKDFDGETKLDWKNYYKTIHADLLSLQEFDVDVSQELAEFEQVLTTHPKKFREKVRAEISGDNFSVREMLRNKTPGILSFLRRLKSPDLPNNSAIVRGIDAGFSDVLQAAQFLEEKDFR